MSKTVKICEAFGPHARVLDTTTNYTNFKQFEGSPTILVPHLGRAELIARLRSDCVDRVVLIDASHCGRVAAFGKVELENAVAGKCRAVIVFGYISEVAAIEQARIPVLAFGVTPRLLPSEIGSADIGFLDGACGLIMHDHYIVVDPNGTVAVELELYQTKFAIK